MSTRALAYFFVVLVVTACSKPADERASPEAPAARAPDATRVSDAADVAVPRVTDDATTLLFSFIDARGNVRAVSSIAEVPKAVRARVGVTDLSLTPEERQAHRYAFFVDLTAKGPDGNYPVTVVSRYDAARGEELEVATRPVPEGTVIVYSAEWCGFCKKAKAWLAEKGVPFVERDVEKEPGVSRELSKKLAAAGIRGGGVPVIDWDGTVIMGFDQRKLSKLLEERQAGGAKEAAR